MLFSTFVNIGFMGFQPFQHFRQDTAARIGNGNVQGILSVLILLFPHGDHNFDGFPGLQRVLDGVFHKVFDQQRWNLGMEAHFLCLIYIGKAARKTDALDADEIIHKFQFLPNCHQLLPPAQYIAEIVHQTQGIVLDHGIVFAFRQSIDCIVGVQQHVRIHLQAQIVHLGFQEFDVFLMGNLDFLSHPVEVIKDHQEIIADFSGLRRNPVRAVCSQRVDCIPQRVHGLEDVKAEPFVQKRAEHQRGHGDNQTDPKDKWHVGQGKMIRKGNQHPKRQLLALPFIFIWFFP